MPCAAVECAHGFNVDGAIGFWEASSAADPYLDHCDDLSEPPLQTFLSRWKQLS